MKLSEENKKIINETLKNGGIVAYVTDTVWGVGCLPNNETGAEKISAPADSKYHFENK